VRVLRVIGGIDPQMGGPSASSVNSCIAAQRCGVQTTVAFPVDESKRDVARSVAVRLTAEGADVRLLPIETALAAVSRRWGVSFPLMNWVISAAPSYDVIHAHGAWTATTASAVIAAHIARRPSALTPHESLTEFDVVKSARPWRELKRVMRIAYMHSCDLLVFSSEMERHDTVRRPRTARDVVIYHPVYDDRGSVQTESQLSDSRMQIGFLGRFDDKKNLDVLLRALVRMPPTVTLTIGGTGASESHLRRLADDLHIQDRVGWVGFVSDKGKRRFFESIDLLVMPSRYECFGMSAAEAMAHGVPAVVSEATGIAEVIREDGGGIVVTPTVKALAAEVSALARSRQKLNRLSADAASAARARFSFEIHGRNLRAAYETLTPPESGAGHRSGSRP
jgi:glycosyltransferase involved in cell wall biosynthesis